jgi:hypothetical protein
MRPSPRQRPQGWLTVKKPWENRTWPVPRQFLQTVGCEPGLAPLPRQVAQVSSRGMTISFSTPVAACSKRISRLYRRSAPRWALRPVRPDRPPKNPSKMSSKMLPKPGSKSPKPPPPRPGLAVPKRL